MSVGVKCKPPVKKPQLPYEYPEGTEYVWPHLAYDTELPKALSDMWMSWPLPKVGP